MKRIIVLFIVTCLILGFCGGCGGTSQAANSSSDNETETKSEPLNLVGNWEQVNRNEDAWQAGFIDENQIQIFWITDGGKTCSLYWAGTYDAPTESVDAYEWTSANNKTLTDFALLASGDDEKIFRYENGEISYQVSAFGSTTTVSLTKCDTDYTSLAFVANNTEEEQEPLPDTNEIAELIDIKYAATTDRTLCVFITNNSEVIIDELEIQALYKDDAGTTISTDSDGHDMVLPGYTVVSRLDAPEEYASVVFEKEVELGVNPNYENHSAEVQLNTHMGSDGIIVEITNNSSVTLDEVEYIVVYYLGDQIVSVSYDEDVYDIEPGKTVTEEEIAPYGVEYDKYEVYLNQAHTFGL